MEIDNKCLMIFCEKFHKITYELMCRGDIEMHNRLERALGELTGD
jgi:hypothetical protein